MKILSNRDLIILERFSKENINTFKYLLEFKEKISVQIDVYDFNTENLLNSINTQLTEVMGDDKIYFDELTELVHINTENILKHFNFYAGNYKTEIKFYKNILGNSQYENRLYIQKISASRKEIFVNYISETEKQQFLTFTKNNFYRYSQKIQLYKFINFGDNNLSLILNSKNQKDGQNENLILKLYEPLPKNILIKDTFWIVEYITDFIEDVVNIYPEIKVDINNYNILQPPTFVDGIDGNILSATKYKKYYDLIDTSSVGKKYFSGILENSDLHGIDLNIKYENFENFVHFGSAAQILENAKNKIYQIEYYNEKLLELPLTQSNSISGSSIYYEAKKIEVLKSLNRYERFLYLNSDSFFTSSLYDGNYIDATCPKDGNSITSSIYSVTSSEFSNWYATMSNIAFDYDDNNLHSLLNTIPYHIKEEIEKNEDYIKFINMIGELYDNIWIYIEAYSRVLKRENKYGDGIPRELLWNVLKNYGLNLSNGNSLVDLSRYRYGYFYSGSNSDLVEIEREEQQVSEEIWNRILNNYPYIFKSKGTKKSILSALNCYGINNSLIKIQEFGGPYITDSNINLMKYSFEYQDFTHVIEMTGSEHIELPWVTSSYDGMLPDSIELKFRTSNISLPIMDLFAISGSANQYVTLKLKREYNEFGRLELEIKGTSDPPVIISSSIKPFYNNEFYSIMVKRGVETDSSAIAQTYYLYIKNHDSYINQILIDESISEYVASSNVNSAYISSDTFYLGGHSASTTKFYGNMDEFRLWAEPLEDDTFDFHSKYSISTNGNTLGSNINTLSFRLSFNNPFDLGATPILENEAYTTSSYYPTATAVGFTSISEYPYNFADYERSNTVEHRFIYPDMQNKKVRIENNYVEKYFDTGSQRVYPLKGNYLVQGELVEGEISEFDSSPPDLDTLLVGFTPVDFINKDIIAFYGNNDLLGTYGDFDNIYADYYPSIDKINDLYYRNSKNSITFNDYLSYIKTYDKSLFRLIRDLIPAKATPIVGTVYEQTILRRNRIKLMGREVAVSYKEHKLQLGNKPDLGLNIVNDLYIDSELYAKKSMKFINSDVDIYSSNITKLLKKSLSNADLLHGGEFVYKLNKFDILSYIDGMVKRQRYTNDRLKLYADSTKNTSLTTIDRGPAVVITATNPKKLKVNYADSPKLRVE